MEKVAVDVVGPLPHADKGNSYVLSAIDYFTKWPEAYALPDQEAERYVQPFWSTRDLTQRAWEEL